MCCVFVCLLYACLICLFFVCWRCLPWFVLVRLIEMCCVFVGWLCLAGFSQGFSCVLNEMCCLFVSVWLFFTHMLFACLLVLDVFIFDVRLCKIFPHGSVVFICLFQV